MFSSRSGEMTRKYQRMRLLFITQIVLNRIVQQYFQCSNIFCLPLCQYCAKSFHAYNCSIIATLYICCLQLRSTLNGSVDLTGEAYKNDCSNQVIYSTCPPSQAPTSKRETFFCKTRNSWQPQAMRRLQASPSHFPKSQINHKMQQVDTHGESPAGTSVEILREKRRNFILDTQAV